MKHPTKGFLLLLATVWLLPGGRSAASPLATHQGRAEIVFAGTSTLHDFSGRVTSTNVNISLTSSNWTASASVPVAKMDTASARRDRNMMNMFSAPEHPLIRGTVTNAAKPGSEGGTVVMKLRIRDVERPVRMQVTAWRESTNSLSFQAAGEVSLKEFSLKPPSVLGVIRVGDRVTLKLDVSTHTR